MKALFLVSAMLGVAASAGAVPINYTFDLTTAAGPAGTLVVAANEDANVLIQLSTLAGTVEIDASGAGVRSVPADTLDIEGGDRLVITPVPATFVGPFTLVSVLFGNVDTGSGNSGDQAIPYLDAVAGSTITLPVSPTAYAPGSLFNTSVAFQNSDGNDDFRVTRIVINGSTPSPAAVPEPSAYSLLGVGVAALAFLRRRRSQG